MCSSDLASTWYLDLDGDTYGDDADAGTLACDASGGRTAPTSGDCDDADAAIHPGAAELCDAADTDEDCDGAADDADTSVATASFSSWYADNDGDGYGGGTPTRACDAAAPYTASTSTDCDDTDAAVSPGATEICDAADTDEDCDGTVDDDDRSLDTSTTTPFYRDADGDGWAPSGAADLDLCDPSGLYAATSTGDCDDTDAAISPDAAEVCDADDTDEDCDGAADDDDTSATGQTTWYRDGDGDGSGTSARSVTACDATASYPVSTAGDCDDADDKIGRAHV